jgi:hypothetical protein
MVIGNSWPLKARARGFAGPLRIRFERLQSWPQGTRSLTSLAGCEKGTNSLHGSTTRQPPTGFEPATFGL